MNSLVYTTFKHTPISSFFAWVCPNRRKQHFVLFKSHTNYTVIMLNVICSLENSYRSIQIQCNGKTNLTFKIYKAIPTPMLKPLADQDIALLTCLHS